MTPGTWISTIMHVLVQNGVFGFMLCSSVCENYLNFYCSVQLVVHLEKGLNSAWCKNGGECNRDTMPHNIPSAVCCGGILQIPYKRDHVVGKLECRS